MLVYRPVRFRPPGLPTKDARIAHAFARAVELRFVLKTGSIQFGYASCMVGMDNLRDAFVTSSKLMAFARWLQLLLT
jgi:hypothetical protein